MVRYYRRRAYRKNYPRKKWASNIGNSEVTLTVPSNSTYAAGAAFALNPAQSPSTVSNSFVVKNVKLSVEAVGIGGSVFSNLNQLIAAIMYVPQGYVVSPSILNEHPEWLMAVKYLGEGLNSDDSTSPKFKPFTVSTRLSRRLQTGDSIQLVLFAQNTSTSQNTSVTFRFLAQWWTRSD